MSNDTSDLTLAQNQVKALRFALELVDTFKPDYQDLMGVTNAEHDEHRKSLVAALDEAIETARDFNPRFNTRS